jgi:hypothetical protein
MCRAFAILLLLEYTKDAMNTGKVENTTIADLHRELVKDLHEIEDQLAEISQRQTQLSGLVEYLEGLYEELPRYSGSPNGEDSPRGKEAISRVLTEADGKWMGVKDIAGELQLRRWIDKTARDPEAAVRAALRRLADQSDTRLEQRKEGRGVSYRMRIPRPSEL